MQFISMTINDQGDAEIETTGFAGKGCDAIHEAFASDLGKIVEKTHKPEYHKPVVAKQKAKARQ